MGRRITIEFTDDDFVPVEAAAHGAQKSVEQWIVERIRDLAPTEARYKAALERLMTIAGAVTGREGSDSAADNEAIDRDLGEEYGSDHSHAA